jgi:hypothetical protein
MLAIAKAQAGGPVVNRREILVGGAASGATLITGCLSHRSQWEVLTEPEGRTLAALCDQIIPGDDWLSASQAGVVTFIDRQLAGPYRRHKKTYRQGLEETAKLAVAGFGVELARASQPQQLEIATALHRQDPDFFELVRRHTLQGFYGSPRRGGNKDVVSWRMLGLDEPPLRGRAQYDSATYAAIFTDAKHNAKRRLMDDCFRCHGMYFDGSIRELVQPQSTSGPWHLTRPELADQPAIPCQTCHWIHREGSPQTKPADRISTAGPSVRDSLAFYDRREEMHFRAASLPIPALYDGPHKLKISADPRQAVCYQCHAPRQPDTNSIAAEADWGPQAGSGDDRTPMGVHEGLSCLACHNGHNENARASCAICHPALSNCGLDVEKMDTSFANAKSAHNIHWVKCADCHQHGIPQSKSKSRAQGE